MHLDVSLAVKTLRQEDLTLVACKGGSVVFKSSNRGVEDLYHLVREQSALLAGASAADKVVGRAAAMLYTGSGVRELFTDKLSRAALAILHLAGVKVQYKKMIPFVMNNDRTGMCPVERLASTVDTLEQLMNCLQLFYREQNACG